MRGLACLRIAATFGTGTLNRAWPAPVFLLRRASVQARCGGWASVPGPWLRRETVGYRHRNLAFARQLAL